MDYEKKYKRLYNFISDLYPFMSEYCKEKVEGFLPELKESEDERISKEIIKYLEQTVPHHHRDEVLKSKEWIAWLEKQGEQKPAWSEKDEKEYKYVLKFVDNILNNCGNKKDYEHSKRCYDWIKSLRPQPKQEWSEEDQNALEDVREAVVHYWGGDTQDILLYWLKSIKQKIKGE